MNKKICIILYSLKMGGVERSFVNLARELVKLGHEVDFVIGERNISPLEDDVRSFCQLIVISPNSKILFAIGIFYYIAKHKPTHILSAFSDINFLVVCASRLLPFNFNTTTTHHTPLCQPSQGKGLIFKAKLNLMVTLMKWYAPRCNNVVAVSNGLAYEINQITKLAPERISVIHNPVIITQSKLHHQTKENRTPFTIIFVGRLSTEKRVDNLLSAFHQFSERVDSKLTIIGDGPQRRSLREQAINIRSDIAFLGFIHDPSPYIMSSDVLVLPSDFEGFGNVLIEAMACGTQVIATDCPYGPNEILEGGALGQLVQRNNVDELAKALFKAHKKLFWVQPELLIKKSTQYTAIISANKYSKLLQL